MSSYFLQGRSQRSQVFSDFSKNNREKPEKYWSIFLCCNPQSLSEVLGYLFFCVFFNYLLLFLISEILFGKIVLYGVNLTISSFRK